MKRKPFNEAEAEAAYHRRVEGDTTKAPRRKRLPMLPQPAPPPLSPLFAKFIKENGLEDLLEEDHPDLESKA